MLRLRAQPQASPTLEQAGGRTLTQTKLAEFLQELSTWKVQQLLGELAGSQFAEELQKKQQVAAILASDQRDPTMTISVLAIASGQSVPDPESTDGNELCDAHAVVLARRALLRYTLAEITRLATESADTSASSASASASAAPSARISLLEPIANRKRGSPVDYRFAPGILLLSTVSS